MKIRERAAVLRPPARARLHFDSDCELAAAPDEIDLSSRRRPLVRELAAAAGVRDLGPQLMEDERLEQRATLGALKRLAQAPRETAGEGTAGV